MTPSIVLKPIKHRNKDCLAIRCLYNRELNVAVRKLPDVRWSQTHKAWYVPATEAHIIVVREQLSLFGPVDVAALTVRPQLPEKWPTEIKPAQSNTVQKIRSAASPMTVGLSTENAMAVDNYLQRLKLKAYSPSTIKTYRNEFLQLLQLLKNKPVDALTPDDLRRYFVYCFEKLKLSENSLHSRINAVKFYFEQVLDRERFFWEIPRPKKTAKLPRFFSKEEMAAIIKGTINLKHKAMLMLAYGSGLRVSEVVALKRKNLDDNRMSILVEDAKGKKDRIVGLSPVLLVVLQEYTAVYKPDKNGYLFEGATKGEPYSTRSLQEVLHDAKARAQILKPGAIHALRHSFATHLIDGGTDVTIIQKLLGHNDIKTTLRYLHTTNRDLLKVISPLDDLSLT